MITTKRTIDSDATLLELSRQAGGKPGAVLDYRLANEEVNGVYAKLDDQIGQTTTTLAALEGQRVELIRNYGVSRNGAAILSDFYMNEATLTRLQTDFDVAKGVYVGLANRYQQARIQVATRSTTSKSLSRRFRPTFCGRSGYFWWRSCSWDGATRHSELSRRADIVRPPHVAT